MNLIQEVLSGVVNAMKDKRQQYVKNKDEISDEFYAISRKLANNGDSLSYNEYTILKYRAEYLRREAENLAIRVEDWEEAVRICLTAVELNKNIIQSEGVKND